MCSRYPTLYVNIEARATVRSAGTTLVDEPRSHYRRAATVYHAYVRFPYWRYLRSYLSYDQTP